MPALDTQTQHYSHLLTQHNLPVQLTSLVGREGEVATLCELLHRTDIHLVTLTGAPGIGKTRLSIEVAHNLLGDFADGVYFVNLAPATDAEAVVHAVATTLGIRQIGDQSLEENLSRFVSGRQILLLLDNFEHVLAAGPMVAQLLRAAPGLKVIATSRELLRLSGEHDFPVPPLSLPPVLAPQGDSGRYTRLPLDDLGDYESVQLFVQRAVAYKSAFELNEENARVIASICRKLDGLPLAIELAAARIRVLSPQAILDRLQDRLTLLTSGARDLPSRQRTLRATVEWSYSLLSEEEARLFRRLAVFRGRRTLEDIEAVCNFGQDLGIEPLDGIASLVDKSLLQQATGPGVTSSQRPDEGSEPRFMLLETIQEYAKEKLEESGEADELRKVHAVYFAELAERAEPELRGPRQGEWLDRLESEQDNFVAALGWAYRNDPDVGLRLVAALNVHWNRRGYLIEGREWASRIIARARERWARSPDTGGSPASISRMVPGSADSGPGGPVHASMARALYTLGIIAFRQANYPWARDLLNESIEIYRELQARGEGGDSTGLVESLNVLGIVVSRLEDMQARRRLHEQALELARQIGDIWSIARSLYQLGHVARLTGDYKTGRALFEETLALFRECGDKFNIGLALIGIGQMAERQADYHSARSLFEESLSVFEELGDKWGISGALYCLGCVHLALRDYTSARAALEQHWVITEELGTKGDKAEALEKLGKAAYFQSDYAGAALLYKRSLSLFQGLGDRMGIALCLMDLAGVITATTPAAERRANRSHGAEEITARQVQTVIAARLLAAAQVLLESVGFEFDPGDRERFRSYKDAARIQLGARMFSNAWAEGRSMVLDQLIAYAQAVSAAGQQGADDQGVTPRRASKSNLGGLTKREREVAAFVTQGKSNRQIAADMVVSERTVEGHVNNILFKLGFRSRAQISAWAVEHGLARSSE